MDIQEVKNETEDTGTQTISKAEQRRRVKDKLIRRGKIKKVAVWIAVSLVILGSLYLLVTANKNRNDNRPGEEVSIQGGEHISGSNQHDPYNSNPPTSGPMSATSPLGFSEIEISDENAVHNLEHGIIRITYKDLDETSIDILRDIAKTYPLSVLVSPREKNDVKVAVSSWGRLLKMELVDKEKIIEYILKNRNKAPEPTAR